MHACRCTRVVCLIRAHARAAVVQAWGCHWQLDSVARCRRPRGTTFLQMESLVEVRQRLVALHPTSGLVLRCCCCLNVTLYAVRMPVWLPSRLARVDCVSARKSKRQQRRTESVQTCKRANDPAETVHTATRLVAELASSVISLWHAVRSALL